MAPLLYLLPWYLSTAHFLPSLSSWPAAAGPRQDQFMSYVISSKYKFCSGRTIWGAPVTLEQIDDIGWRGRNGLALEAEKNHQSPFQCTGQARPNPLTSRPTCATGTDRGQPPLQHGADRCRTGLGETELHCLEGWRKAEQQAAHQRHCQTHQSLSLPSQQAQRRGSRVTLLLEDPPSTVPRGLDL